MNKFYNELATAKPPLVFSEAIKTKFQYVISNYKGFEIHLAFYSGENRDKNLQAIYTE
jgi:hypothetical protein